MSQRFAALRRDRKETKNTSLHDAGSSTGLKNKLATQALCERVLNARVLAIRTRGVGCQSRKFLAAIRSISYVQRAIGAPHVFDTRTSMQ